MALENSILILTTGGTIDKQYFDSLSQYQITDTTVTKLLDVGRVTHSYEVKEVLRKDSIERTDDDRARVVENVRQAAHSRIIITHGTDTMTLTAHALSMIPNKTIVLTGALAPSRFSESDAAFNLGMAFAIAQVHLGLDDQPSWVVVDDFNVFTWPGYDLRPVPGQKDRYHYGLLPPRLFVDIIRRFSELRRQGGGARTSRDDETLL
jgi:L-asparaginase